MDDPLRQTAPAHPPERDAGPPERADSPHEARPSAAWRSADASPGPGANHAIDGGSTTGASRTTGVETQRTGSGLPVGSAMDRTPPADEATPPPTVPNPDPMSDGAGAPGGDTARGHRLHPAWIAIGAIRRFRGFVVPLAVLAFTRDPGEAGVLVLVLLATAATLGWQAAEWATTRWSVAGNQVRLTTGVLGRRERLVPLERVQSIDLTDTPLERLFGVAGVRIETAAGGAQGGIVLEAVGRREAEALRTDLLAARAALTESPAPVGPPVADSAAGARRTNAGSPAPATAQSGFPATTPTPGLGATEPLVRMGWRDVLIAGATSGRIGPAVALLGFGIGLLDDVADLPIAGRLAGWLPMAGERGPGTVVVAILLGAAIAWLLAIGGAALTWGGFELRRDADRIYLSHGLLDRRRRTVPLKRIQAISVRESPLRRPFGLAEIRFESAGWGAGEQDSGVLVPLVRTADAPALLAAIALGLAPPPEMPEFHAPPARARGRYLAAPLRGLAVVVALGVAAAGFAPGIAWWWGLALLAGLPLAIAHGWLGWRDSGWALDGDRLLLRTGGLEQSLTVAPRRRLQRRGTRQTPFARRAGLATFAADVASGGGGGRLSVPHLDAAEAARLVAALRD